MALSIQSSPGLNNNEDIEVIPIPKQDPLSRPLLQASASAGTRTTNPINLENSAPQTLTPANSAIESQGDQEAAQSKKRKNELVLTFFHFEYIFASLLTRPKRFIRTSCGLPMGHLRAYSYSEAHGQPMGSPQASHWINGFRLDMT
jgi:hypothetical protein